jgi:uncharacterized membrane protein
MHCSGEISVAAPATGTPHITHNPHPNMSKIPSIAFLVVGIVLLVYGINASNSVTSSITQSVSGTPTDKSIWLIVLGVIGIVSGGVGIFFRRSQ